MFIDLINKEYTFSRNETRVSTLGGKVLSWIFKIIGAAILIALEVFIYYSLDNQVSNYTDTTSTNFAFVVVFSSLAVLISIIFTTLKARKVLYNKQDYNILATLPISTTKIVLSKSTYLLLYCTLINVLVTSPIIITFLAIRSFMPVSYVLAVVLSAFISIFATGIALIFAIICEYLYRLIKVSDLIQFILAVVVVVVLCFLYQLVLNVFLSGLTTNEGTGLLSSSLVGAVEILAIYLVPLYSILTTMVSGINLLSSLCILFGLTIAVGLVGLFVAGITYERIHSNDKEIYIKKIKNNHIKMYSPFVALIKKEFTLLFKDSSNIFSYTALLIMMPFLSFVVIASLNSIIYTNLRIYAVYFPDLINGLNILLILLFSSAINASASSSMSREGKSLMIVKYLPIEPQKQILAKIIPPIALSSASLLVTNVVLVASGNIDYKVFLLSLFVGLILIVFTSIFGLYADMHDKGDSIKFKLTPINTFVSIGWPFIILIVHFGLSFTSMDTMFIYIVESILSLLLIVPIIFIFLKKTSLKAFSNMEVN